METKEITLTRTFDAPREKVWSAWTNASEVQAWWGPRGTTIPVCELDAQVGGKMHIVMLAGPELGPMAGQKWPMQGIFQTVDGPNTLVFTNQALDDNGSVIIDGLTTAIFEDVSGKTKLTVTTGGSSDAPQAAQMLGGMEQGWNQQLDKLAEYLA